MPRIVYGRPRIFSNTAFEMFDCRCLIVDSQ